MRLLQLFILMAGFSLISSGCVGHIPVLDKEKCVDEGSLGAHCAHEYSGGERDIPQPDWDNTRFGWFCMDVDDTLESKKEWEMVCSLKGVSCDLQGQQRVQSYIHHSFLFRNRMQAHARAARARLEEVQ